MSKLKIILISLLLIIVSALAFFIYHLKTSEEIIAKLVFENGEANYLSEDVKFTFISKNENKASIEIYNSSDLEFDDDELYFRSDKSYILNGKIKDFSGKLEIRFPLSEKLINKFGENLKNNLFILSFEESYCYPEKDTVLMPNFMRIKIDTLKKEVYTSFDFSRLEYVDSTQNYKIAFELICYEDRLRTKSSKDFIYKERGNFLAINTAKINKTSLSFILEELEKQYNKISNLNYAVRQNPKQIQVKFTELTKNGDINYIQNIYIPKKKWIEINKVPYLNRNPKSLSKKEIRNFKLLSGTSLMHLNLNNYAFKHWFNKAVVNWYETIALADSSHVQEFELDDFKTLNKAFFFERENSDKLNSLFFAFLMRKGGFFFGSNLYNRIKLNKRNFQYNLQKTLGNKKLQNIYVEFFDVLLRNPNKLFPALSDNNILDYLIYDNLKIQVETENKKIKIIHSDKFVKGSLLKKNTNNTFLINYKLENFSTSFFKLDLKSLNSETKKRFIDGDYKLKISLSGDDNIGLFVYKNIGNKLILVKDKLVFYSVNGISELEISDSAKFLISIINYDDKLVDIPESKNITIKLEIVN